MLKKVTVIGKQDNMMGFHELCSEQNFRQKASADKKTVYVNITTGIIHCKKCKATQAVVSDLIDEIFKEVRDFRLKHTACNHLEMK